MKWSAVAAIVGLAACGGNSPPPPAAVPASVAIDTSTTRETARIEARVAGPDSTNASAWGELAASYHRDGRTADAVRAARRAFDLAPLDGEWENLLHDLGETQYAAPGAAARIAALERFAAGPEAENAWTWERLAKEYLAGGRREDAIRAFRRAYEIDPEPLLRERILALGDTAGVAQVDASRLRALETAAAANGGRNAEAWGDLARAYQRAGRIDDAIRALRRAQALQPAEPEWSTNLHALERERAGPRPEPPPLPENPQARVVELERRVARAPDSEDPEVWLELCHAYSAVGREEDARRAERRAYDLGLSEE